jgi:hypothetical protein
MYPEYTVYQASPHSRVTCAECHVGSGADYLVRSKISGLPLVIDTLAGTYERPIPTPVENLRPAPETCEQCHRPERFAGDVIRVHTTYDTDETNTQQSDIRAFRVGGGELELAKDIHWHVAARVWYLPLDKQRQDIVWISVEDSNGQLVEYIDPDKATEVNPQRLEAEKRLMDCMDCHNRATHIFRSPDELIDLALAQGKIDADLPFIKREGLEILTPPNPSLEEAIVRVEAIKEFYSTSYPQVYQEKEQAIDEAIAALKDIARLTTFPQMQVTWETYIDNLGHGKLMSTIDKQMGKGADANCEACHYLDNSGHGQFPGCFRCHDKLLATTGEQKGNRIDADCEACHYFELGQNVVRN